MESKVELVLEQIRRAQANAHNVALYRKTLQHGSAANAYVRDALSLARGQLLEAVALIDGELEAAKPSPATMFAADLPSDKPTASTPKVTWTKVPGGIELARRGPYQVAVTGMRGDWYYTVTKNGQKTPERKGNATSKKLAQGEGIGWADELMDDDQRKSDAARSAGIGFDKLSAALEKARVQVWDDMKHEPGHDKPMTPRDFSNLLDGFVNALVGALDPEQD